MKVTVKSVFADRFTYQMYAEGDVIEVADARAHDLIDRGLCAPVETAEKAKPAPKGGKKKKSEDD